MQKKKLSLDREVLTRSMLLPDGQTDAASPSIPPTTPTSIISIITSILSIKSQPPTACPDETE